MFSSRQFVSLSGIAAAEVFGGIMTGWKNTDVSAPPDALRKMKDEIFEMSYKTIAVIIIIVTWLYGMILELLDRRSSDNPIPENVADVYDPETYKKWRAYHGEKSRFSFISRTMSCLISLVLILSDVYPAFARLFPKSDFMQMLSVFLLSSLTDLLLLPLSWYDTMVIEEKYGFNRTDKKTFWLDTLKETLIGLVLMVIIGSLLMWVHKWLGDRMIIVFAVLMTLLVLAISFLAPVFTKIFNKFTPLEEGELKEKLTDLLEKHGYKVRAIQVMDASRRSTKANAYFTGFGKMKTIVLYDTLMAQMTTDEICAVFSHEMGHGLHKDTLKNQIFSAVQMFLMAVLAWLTLRKPAIFRSFGFDGINYGFAIILIGFEFALFSPAFSLLINAYSRKAEFRADQQAVTEGYGPALISGLKKLTRENFGDLAPDPLLVKLTYSHPTLSQRISAIMPDC